MKTMWKIKPLASILALLFLTLLSACIVVQNPHTGLAPGRWRGVLKLTPGQMAPPDESTFGDLQFEEVSEGELPFLFDVVYDDEERFHIELINGEERIRAEHITIGRDPATARDTILIEFPVYDTYISALYENDVLEGEWVVNYKDNYRIPFVAHFGQGYRFTQLRKTPDMDLSGKWEVNFGLDTDAPYPAVGEFRQEGNQLYGTFLTETGDYRFLEGTVQADKFYLSCFDGSHAFLFEGKILPDSTLIGSFRSGSHHRSTWEGKRNDEARLADPHLLTTVTDDQPLNLSLEDPDGNLVSLDDEAYAGKVKVVQIMGTWCPNCRDETDFLNAYQKAHPGEELAFLAVAFERYPEKEKAMEALRRFSQNMQLGYPIVLGGTSNKQDAGKVFPMLSGIKAYPTLLLLDRQNRIRRIHTGFSGPATSEYARFQEEFDRYLQQLLAEK
jgi:thiol-disulfide isomerase/thioredoxin